MFESIKSRDSKTEGISSWHTRKNAVMIMITIV